MHLRPYQEAAKAALYGHLRARDDNPCVVIPTAGGKTPLMASICQDAVTQWQGRVLILAHVKELLAQAADKLRAVCPDVPFGVYSAGLKRRDTTQPIIIAGIQSVYRKACDLDAFDLVLIDEAHLIPCEGDGMYRQFLADALTVNPRMRIAGFTATPYRLKSGQLCTPDGFLNTICYEVGVRELVRDGYLCPPIAKEARTQINTDGLAITGGDFVADAAEALMDRDELVEAACAEIVEHTRERQACLLFASGVRHGEHMVHVLAQRHGIDCGFVTGATPQHLRDEVLGRFRRGQMKYLCNVNVLTTGFDAPHIYCVALLRPTLSPGLYYQMVGRGFRLHPGKENFLVLDFGGNVLRHGPVDQIHVKNPGAGKGRAPLKTCPGCQALVAAGYARCPWCGFEFPPPQRKRHEPQAGTAGVLSGQVVTTWFAVEDVFYRVHTRHGAAEGDPKTLRVDYRVGFNEFKSEWVCLEHTGYARARAVAWWQRRSACQVPDTVQRAVDLAHCGAVALTTAVAVRSVAGEPYERIIDYRLDPIPVDPPDDADDSVADQGHDDGDEAPF